MKIRMAIREFITNITWKSTSEIPVYECCFVLGNKPLKM